MKKITIHEAVRYAIFCCPPLTVTASVWRHHLGSPSLYQWVSVVGHIVTCVCIMMQVKILLSLTLNLRLQECWGGGEGFAFTAGLYRSVCVV